MSDTIEILGLLQEEASEIIQIASKIRRFGLESNHPDDQYTTNQTLLERELGDFLALFTILHVKGVIDPERIANYANAKFDKLVRFNAIEPGEIPPKPLNPLTFKEEFKAAITVPLPEHDGFKNALFKLSTALNPEDQKHLCDFFDELEEEKRRHGILDEIGFEGDKLTYVPETMYNRKYLLDQAAMLYRQVVDKTEKVKYDDED